jgi:hypothetical protein
MTSKDPFFVEGWGYWDDDPTGEVIPLATDRGCSHEWVNVSFMHTKWVCLKCNEEKPEEEL